MLVSIDFESCTFLRDEMSTTEAEDSNESYSSSDEEDDENALLERASEGASELEILGCKSIPSYQRCLHNFAL